MMTLLFASLAFAGPHHHVRPAEPPPTLVVVAPRPAPPPRVVVAAPLPMSADRFSALVYAVDAEPFSDDQLAVIRMASSYEFFTVAQLGRLMDELAFSSDRVEAARLLRPRILDPENAWMLNEHLIFSSDKQAVQRMFY